MALYRCQPCGYIYHEEKGDLTRGIKPGTKFSDLPEDWVCPVCGAGKEQFVATAESSGGGLEPTGLLMIEHRLIEKIVPVLIKEIAKLEQGAAVDTDFVAAAGDFFRNYADRLHHGKEEDILFRELTDKNITAAERELLDKLVAEHREARENVGALLKAAAEYAAGDSGRAGEIIKHLAFLTELYPRHIRSEDKIFFPAAMNYFSVAEQQAMLARMREFDQKIRADKYRSLMKLWEKR